MTTTDDRPVNGHRIPPTGAGELDLPSQPPRSPVPRTKSSTPPLLAGMPSAEHLTALRDHAAAVIAVQDAPELRAVKSLDEIEAERQVDAEHRDDLLTLRRERNRAVIERGKRELKTETTIDAAAHRDQLDASKARAMLGRLTSPVGYLASQMRARRLSLLLTTIPAVVAVVLGSIQVQATVTTLLHLASGDPVAIMLFGLEPLITLPLVAILIYQGGTPGGSPSTWREFTGARFVKAEVGLLAASVLVNVGPHVILRQYGTAAIWLAVPAAIVLTLNLLPQLADAYTARIMDARMDAELGSPTRRLSGADARRFRQVALIIAADAAGEIGGFRDEHGLPSTTQILKTLKAKQGTAAQEDAMAVTDALRLLRGVEPDAGV